MARSSTPSSPPSPPGGKVVAIDLRTLRYSEILRMLFVSPKLAWMLCGMKHFFFTSIAAMVLLCLLGSCAVTMSSLPDRTADLRPALDFLVETAGEVRFNGRGGLEWAAETDSRLPAAARLNRMRMDILPSMPDERQEASIHASDDREGIIVTRNGIRYWSKNGGKSTQQTPVMTLDFPDGRARKILAGRSKDGSTPPIEMLPLNSGTVPFYTRMLFITLFMTIWLANFLAMLKFIFSGAFCIGMVTLFFNGKRAFSGWRGVFSLGLNTLFPPVIATCIYATAASTMDFAGIFPFVFVAYMCYAIFEAQRGRVIP